MVILVGGRQNLALVDEIDADGFQHLRFGEMADTAFGHNGNGDGLHDLLDQLRRAHAGDAPGGADIGWDALQRHDGDRARVFGHFGLIGGDDIHNHPALEHFGEACFDVDDVTRSVFALGHSRDPSK